MNCDEPAPWVFWVYSTCCLMPAGKAPSSSRRYKLYAPLVINENFIFSRRVEWGKWCQRLYESAWQTQKTGLKPICGRLGRCWLRASTAVPVAASFQFTAQEKHDIFQLRKNSNAGLYSQLRSHVQWERSGCHLSLARQLGRAEGQTGAGHLHPWTCPDQPRAGHKGLFIYSQRNNDLSVNRDYDLLALNSQLIVKFNKSAK